MLGKRSDYEEFREIIRIMAEDIIDKKLKEKNIYVSQTGSITKIIEPENNNDPFNQKCSVDLVFTQINDILNKSGELLKVGDTVKILVKEGSSFSDCFIAWKNA